MDYVGGYGCFSGGHIIIFISRSTNTGDMFTRTGNLKQLTLVKKSQLKSDMHTPDVPNTDGYTLSIMLF